MARGNINRIRENSRFGGTRVLVAAILMAAGVPLSFAQGGQSAFQPEKLDDKKPSVRAAAVDTAGKRGNAAGAGEIIKRLSKETDPVVKIHMLHSLGNIGDNAAVKTLAGEAAGGATADIRAQACMSLSSFAGDKAAEEALRKALLRSGEEDNVRLSAAFSLMTAFRGSQAAVAAIEAVLKDASKPLKLGIIDNLRHVHGTKEGKLLLGAAAADKDAEVKSVAEQVLSGAGRSEGRFPGKVKQ